MEDIVQNGPKMIYCPAIAIDSITVHHTFGKLAVTPLGEPEILCGIARRVGYTDGSNTALALYRLKIKIQGQRIYVTLPSLFVVVGGIFLDYEHWLAQQKQGEATIIAKEDNPTRYGGYKDNDTSL